jgi:diguanylate cyclase (GGDEF)-like protein
MYGLAAFLANRVAWRVFARFVVASLVPLAVLAALVFTEVRQTLEQRALDHLRDASHSIGQVVLDKLLSTSDLLGNVASFDDSEQIRALGLDAVRYEAAGRRITFGLADALPSPPRDLDRARPVLDLIEDPAGARVVLARAVAGGGVVARFDRQYLLDAAALARGNSETCVFARSLLSDPVFCTDAKLAGAASRRFDEETSTGAFTWSLDGEAWLVGYWQLFIPSRFNGEPWFIVTAMPRSVALEPVSLLGNIAPQALALSLLLMTLLSFSQIRRTLEPLSRLVGATRRIAAQEFDTRIDVSGNDELASLARAMNDMAAQLGRQFRTLTTLASIDRLILYSESIDEVVEAILARAGDNAAAREVAVLLVDTDDETHANLFRRGAAAAPLSRVQISPQHCSELLAWTDGQALDPNAARLLGLSDWCVPHEDERLFAAPILRGRAFGGLLLATLPSPTAAADLGSLGELAGRLSVAVTAGERERNLIRRAHFDQLTGMPNRQLCHDRLQQALAQARREHHRVAVLFIDLDGFKNINDSLGHIAGDELLKDTALRLSAAARDVDTVARFGGDEYVVILPQLQSALEVEAVVGRIMAALETPFTIHGRESFISGSIGATLFPEDGLTPEELLRKADTAMYSAKAAGRSRCVFFTKEMDVRVQDRLALSSDLRRALERDELSLVYQPVISLDGNCVASAEALLRWRHPTRGLVSPDLFVPIMEENGLMGTVGAWVLRTALCHLAAWRQAGLLLPRIAVNVAARQLLEPGFVDTVIGALRAAELEPSDLELELTETTLVNDLRSANARLDELSALGVRISIDDFGAGYSSLGYLNELTFDTVKIDRAFVASLPADKSVAIVRAIVAVARALGKEVVAEGVESERQRLQLTKLGCNRAQGYLFSIPLDEPAFAKWLGQFSRATSSVQDSEVA